MATPRWQSGFMLEGNVGGPPGNFEMVVAPVPLEGCSHYWRDNGASGTPWNGPSPVQLNGGWMSPSLILSTWGNLEVAANNAGIGLDHFYRNPLGWQGPFRVWSVDMETGELPGTFGIGAPALIQSRFGAPGNFEILAPYHARSGHGIRHFWRGPDPNSWQHGAHFATPHNFSGLAFLHSTYFENFEIVATDVSGQLWFIWGLNSDWSEPGLIGRGRGRPGFIQGPFGSRGNFEVVVAWPDGGLAHYWRDNNIPGQAWSASIQFGERVPYDAVSLFHSSYGNLEVAAQRANYIDFYFRDPPPSFHWHGPYQTVGPIPLRPRWTHGA